MTNHPYAPEPLRRGLDSLMTFGDAPCTQSDPELFYPPGNEEGDRYLRRTIKELCASCPLQKECRKQALETDMAYGYHGWFAGLSPKSRKAEDFALGIHASPSAWSLCPVCGDDMFNAAATRHLAMHDKEGVAS